MEAELNKKMRTAKMKERMKAKAEMNKLSKNVQAVQSQQTQQRPTVSDEELIALFSKGEKAEKTPRNANPILTPTPNSNPSNQTTTKPKNNKKKGKK